MNKIKFRSLLILVITILITGITPYAGAQSPSKGFTVQIKDKPMTFINPLMIEGVQRGGEPIVLIFQDDYYLFVTGGRGYWYSPNMRNWWWWK